LALETDEQPEVLVSENSFESKAEVPVECQPESPRPLRERDSSHASVEPKANGKATSEQDVKADSERWQRVQREAGSRRSPPKEKPPPPSTSISAKAPTLRPVSSNQPKAAARTVTPTTRPRIASASSPSSVSAPPPPQRNPWKVFTDRLGVRTLGNLNVKAKEEEKTVAPPVVSQRPPPPSFKPPQDLPMFVQPEESLDTWSYIPDEASMKLQYDESAYRYHDDSAYEMMCSSMLSAPHMQELPGLASMGIFSGWSTGGTGGTADFGRNMEAMFQMVAEQGFPAYYDPVEGYDSHEQDDKINTESGFEDDVDLRLEAMVEDLAGADHKHLIEDAFTKVDAARAALSKVLTTSLRHSAPSFVPGQMWMGASETETTD
jgi:hypothetical protein